MAVDESAVIANRNSLVNWAVLGKLQISMAFKSHWPKYTLDLCAHLLLKQREMRLSCKKKKKRKKRNGISNSWTDHKVAYEPVFMVHSTLGLFNQTSKGLESINYSHICK